MRGSRTRWRSRRPDRTAASMICCRFALCHIDPVARTGGRRTPSQPLQDFKAKHTRAGNKTAHFTEHAWRIEQSWRASREASGKQAVSGPMTRCAAITVRQA